MWVSFTGQKPPKEMAPGPGPPSLVLSPGETGALPLPARGSSRLSSPGRLATYGTDHTLDGTQGSRHPRGRLLRSGWLAGWRGAPGGREGWRAGAAAPVCCWLTWSPDMETWRPEVTASPHSARARGPSRPLCPGGHHRAARAWDAPPPPQLGLLPAPSISRAKEERVGERVWRRWAFRP